MPELKQRLGQVRVQSTSTCYDRNASEPFNNPVVHARYGKIITDALR